MSDDNTNAPRDEERRPRSTRWSSGGRASSSSQGSSARERDERGRNDRGRDGWRRDEHGRGERGGFDRGREDRRGNGEGRETRSRDDGRGGYGEQRRDDRGGYARGGRDERGGYGRRDDRDSARRDDRGGFARRDDRGQGDRRRDGGRSSDFSRRDDRFDGDRRGGHGRRDERDDRRGGSDRGYGERRDDRGSDRRDVRGGERRVGDERRGGGSGRGYGDRRDDRGRDDRPRFDRSRDDRGRGDDRRSFDRGPGRGSFDRGGAARGERGAGWSDEQASIRGPRSWDAKATGDERPRRKPEPVLPEGITGYELDKDVRQQLRTLSKDNAEGVAQHLVAAAELLDEDPEKALDHAQHAVSRAGRVPAAREALGLVLYRTGEFAEALREFRTARRLSGSDHLLPYMVDCERGLGRYERALELANSPEAKRLSEADNIELAIVVSGVRRDMGQARAAVIGLRIPALTKATSQPWAARLFYAYADALLAMGENAEAREWFVKADAADHDGETDASDRVDQIDGFELDDLAPEDEQDVDPRFADLDLSAFGAVKPGSAPAEGASTGAEASLAEGAPRADGTEADDVSVEADRANTPAGSRQVPSASFDDGSSRG